MKRFIIIVFSLLCINGLAQGPSGWKDLNYARDSEAYHTLDIHLPPVKKASYPVVVAIYGSAWFG